MLNSDGIAIRSTFENEITVSYAALVSGFTQKSRAAIRQLDPDNDIKFLRIRSKKHEIIISPEFEKKREYVLVVVHNPTVMPAL